MAARAIVVLGVGRVLQMAATIVTLRLLTTSLAPVEAGHYYWLSALLAVGEAPIAAALVNYYSRNLIEWSGSGEAWHRMRQLLKALAVLAIVVPLPIAFIAQATQGLPAVHVYAVLVLTVFASEAANVAVPCINILGARLPYVAVSTLAAFMKPLLAVALVRAWQPSSIAWYGGTAAGAFLTTTLALGILRAHLAATSPVESRPIPSLDRKLAFAFMWPITTGMLLYWGQTQANRLIVERVLSLEHLGTFAAAYSAGAGLLVAFEALFQQYFQPIFYRGVATPDEGAYQRTMQLLVDRLLPAVAPVALLITFGARPLAWMFLGARFQSGYRVIGWAAAAETIRIMSSCYHFAALGKNETRLLLPPAIVGASTALLGVAVFGRAYANDGLGLAMVLGAVATLVTFAIIMRRRVRFALPWRKLVVVAGVSGPGCLALAMLPARLSLFSVSIGFSVAGLSGAAALYLAARDWVFPARVPAPSKAELPPS